MKLKKSTYNYFDVIKSNHQKIKEGKSKVFISDDKKCRHYIAKYWHQLEWKYAVNDWLSIDPKEGFFYFGNKNPESLDIIDINALLYTRTETFGYYKYSLIDRMWTNWKNFKLKYLHVTIYK